MPASSSSSFEQRPSKITKMDDSIDVTDAVTGTAPVPSYRPDAKTRRYDRQLRLWASAGQRSLEQARVLLVGCDAAGSQTLKNLVLPGISHFTILASQIVKAQDVATSFFLHPNSIGLNIAQESVKYLSELNPAVEGAARCDDPAELLITDPQFFLNFTLVILSNVDPDLELQIANLLWKTSEVASNLDIPLISIRSSGFASRMQIQFWEHTIVDSHPDTTHTLRLNQPFSTLEEHARSLNFAVMDTMEHSHIPWVVLLVRAACIWKDSHDGKLPETSEEKSQFKEQLIAEKAKGDEENYEEALSQAYRVWNSCDVSWDIKQLLEEDNIKNISSNSKNLHILLHTLAQYLIPAPHLPPTSPSLPDMHSSTVSYVALQNLYKAQFQTDLTRFKALLNENLRKIGLSEDSIPDDEVQGFVKNVGGVGIVRGTALKESKENSDGLLSEITTFDEKMDTATCLSMFLALLAGERFFLEKRRWPGTASTKELEKDNHEIGKIVKSFLPQFLGLPDIVSESIAEVNRGGYATIPTTAAFVGGVAAQEAIKLVTNQYIPLNNTIVFNLVKSESAKFKF
ncbi:uncharacterized protein L203_104347 [Cryptococcus depauperatus CBS 7841]|uniref:NEDD8-activating enzyme E1 regulatory subunit n=1 Tax=Cryptococcus depauperatus CBS 7841 TaxID=1295531 RepID=A0AAJ8M313_9TREE